jgi:hypothetical protein
MFQKIVNIDVFRSRDESSHQIGETIPIKEGFVGLILARFVPQSDSSKDGYVVESRRSVR